ncbi:DNA recombination protein RmuC [Edaphobacter modestus]|uniref:DNA recombination protein RmuC n=1 Tax=Edaphobacter modestus TaxID=388466 RepID=A0A4Q7YWE0_9BACT|nr:DNA recombination protein RmuC [Edaphobacter modestus]RZU41501.1 DNA recombination protein RmuC [Edaphobacter modestus]
MLTALLAIQIVVLIAVVALLLRKQQAPSDPRLTQLPDQLTRLDARNQALDEHIRNAFSQMRADLADEAKRTREASATDFASLRKEVTSNIAELSQLLQGGLNSFRDDNKTSDNLLRKAVQDQMDTISQRIASFTAETNKQHIDLRESLNQKLKDLTASNTDHQTQLRNAVEERLEKINTTNASKLEEMRNTVDEKLQTTLQTRLTESFGQVTDQLNKVHSGLGEMTKLSDGVNDLSRIFTNVKSRGGFAEVQLGMLLEQMLAPSQFLRNAKVRDGSQEVVEFAVRFPGQSGETLLPIDAKFPREDWERLEGAYESGNSEQIAAAGKAFEGAIRTEGDRICSKYINPPRTTPHAIMFLPTEGLYAEVMRRDALQAEIQSKCRVTIAGPSTLSAILTSFQMGFHMLAIQEKGDEVWNVLEGAKKEFGKFEGLMDKMDKQVGTVQNTIRDLGQRSRAIHKTLREVGTTEKGLPGAQLIDFDQAAGITTFLAASGEDD